jgi:hypothetical protein
VKSFSLALEVRYCRSRKPILTIVIRDFSESTAMPEAADLADKEKKEM